MFFVLFAVRHSSSLHHEGPAFAPTCPPYKTLAGGSAAARRHEEHESG
jgi:hypothetical protein